ncbi:MAG: (d)CMP kinase [Pseudomonadota bacterium]
MKTDAPVITIDGPSGTGKGTLSQLLATKLQWHLLDSGAMYRVLALAALDSDIDLDDELQLAQLALELDINFTPDQNTGVPSIQLAGAEVSERIREHEISEASSRVAAHPPVRTALLDLQRAFRRAPGLVADGRDMGSTVFPMADLKVFLTASADARAQRRYKQLKTKEDGASLRALREDLAKRDQRDMTRTASPLRPADDALIIDSTEMSIEQVLERLLDAVKQRGLC